MTRGGPDFGPYYFGVYHKAPDISIYSRIVGVISRMEIGFYIGIASFLLLQPLLRIYVLLFTRNTDSTVEARKLEYDCPPTPSQRKKEHRHESSKAHLPTSWSLL